MIDLEAAVNAGIKIVKKTTPRLSFKISAIAHEVMSYGVDLRNYVSKLEGKSKKMRRAAVVTALLVPPELMAYSYAKGTNSNWENLILLLFACTGLTGGYFMSQYRLYNKLTTYLRTGQDGDIYKTEFVWCVTNIENPMAHANDLESKLPPHNRFSGDGWFRRYFIKNEQPSPRTTFYMFTALAAGIAITWGLVELYAITSHSSEPHGVRIMSGLVIPYSLWHAYKEYKNM